MTTAIRLYRTYILSTFVPLNTIRRDFGLFSLFSKIVEKQSKKKAAAPESAAACNYLFSKTLSELDTILPSISYVTSKPLYISRRLFVSYSNMVSEVSPIMLPAAS